MVVEVDDFAEIQEAVGERAINLISAEIVRRLRVSLRSTDELHSIGQGRFVAVCRGVVGSAPEIINLTSDLAERWRRDLSRPPVDGEVEVVVSIAVEVAIGRHS